MALPLLPETLPTRPQPGLGSNSYMSYLRTWGEKQAAPLAYLCYCSWLPLLPIPPGLGAIDAQEALPEPSPWTSHFTQNKPRPRVKWLCWASRRTRGSFPDQAVTSWKAGMPQSQVLWKPPQPFGSFSMCVCQNIYKST